MTTSGHPVARIIDTIRKKPDRGCVPSDTALTTSHDEYRKSLEFGHSDTRDGVLDDLTTYYSILSAPPEPDLDATAALLWHAYEQAHRPTPPAPVIAAAWLTANVDDRPREHLDLGAGVGVTNQLFVRRGWSSTIAEISPAVLEFARFRLERRGVPVEYVDLRRESISVGSFDAITAFDVLERVPDPERALRQLHDALAPAGFLLTEVPPHSGRGSGYGLGSFARAGLGLTARIPGGIGAFRSTRRRRAKP